MSYIKRVVCLMGIVVFFVFLTGCQSAFNFPQDAPHSTQTPHVDQSSPTSTQYAAPKPTKTAVISQADPSPSPDPSPPSTPIEIPAGDETVLYLGIMVHLEHWDDAGDQAEFEEHVRLIREYADLFETYGGKLTWESKELTEGIIKWGDNVLLEMEGRGHGVGVHADVGGVPAYDCDHVVEALRHKKERLDSLGVEVRHVSGIASHCDWVTAAIETGYEFTTGQVAYSLMSLPEDQRPGKFRHCQSALECHDVFPTRIEDRIHPWRMKSGEGWLTHDPEGELVMLASSQGLACMEEEILGTPGKGCTFQGKDIDLFLKELEKALAVSEPGMINIYYVWWSIGEQMLDKALVEEWLQAVEPYLASGQVEWKTLPEMYEAYLQWERTRDSGN